MKENKLITILIIILIIGIVAILGVLGYQLITNSINVSNNANLIQNAPNTESNTVANIQDTNNIANNQTEVIQPILNDINSNNNEQNSIAEEFSATYYYSQLDETSKVIYDGLKSSKEKLTSGNYTINYGTKFNTLLHETNGKEKLNKAFQSAWNAFFYDNIDLYYIDVTKMNLINESTNVGGITTYKIKIGTEDNSNYFQPDFKTKEDVDNANIYLENIKKQIAEQTSTNNDYSKILRVYNWIISTIEYDNSTTENRNKYTIYGALKNKKAVCEGYARTFKYLMDGIGIPCILISGNATNSEGATESHAWNYVQINEQWYAVDTTWDDPVITENGQLTNEIKYKYFLKGSEEFLKDHKEDGMISENSIKFKFPTLSLKNYEN